MLSLKKKEYLPIMMETNNIKYEMNAMPVGFVLINTSPQKEHEVYNNLIRIEEISEVHPLFGSYDLIVKIEVKDYDDLGSILMDKIRSLDGIIDTKTLTGTSI
jgi:DNA-binding Lrp family transcriptional regulator